LTFPPRLGRRGFIAGGAALAVSSLGVSVLSGRHLALPWVTPAAQTVTIGVISPSPDNPSSPMWQKLSKYGWTRGDNLSVEYRTGDTSTFRSLAAELVSLRVALIIATSEPPARAAKQATDTIPIVFTVVDALGAGLVTSMARPGGNLTGLSVLGPETGEKSLDLLRELSPGLARVAVLWHPGVVEAFRIYTRIANAARAVSVDVISALAGFPNQVASALDYIERNRVDGLIVLNLVAYSVPSARRDILNFAAAQTLPTIYSDRSWVVGGGLMSYSFQADAFAERTVIMVDRILRGANPADLPVEQPTAFDLAINRTTAQALGITIPPDIAAQVTEWVP
jgi:putative ABC transport system substrate-binding protein